MRYSVADWKFEAKASGERTVRWAIEYDSVVLAYVGVVSGDAAPGVMVGEIFDADDGGGVSAQPNGPNGARRGTFRAVQVT